MNRIYFHACLVAILVAFALCSGTAIAQGTPQDSGRDTADAAVATPDDTPSARAEALVAKIEQDYRELETLTVEPAGESARDKKLREAEIRADEVRIGGLIHDLAVLVLDEGDAAELAQPREKLTRWLQQLPKDIADALDRRRSRLEELRQQRDEAPDSERIIAEQRVVNAGEAIDELLADYTRQVLLMERMDLDATAVREDALDRLRVRAEAIASRLTLARDDLAQVERVLEAAPDDADARQRQLVLQQRLDAGVASLRSAVSQLRSLDFDASDYQKLLVQVTGDVSDVGLNTSVMTSLAADWLQQGREWITTGGPRLLGEGLIVIIILTLSVMLARFARRVVDRALKLRPKGTSTLLQRTMSNLAGQLVMLLGLLVALSQIGISVGPMLAGLGIAGFVIAFALQDTLSNFASGAFILFYRPFDEGDVVEAGGVTGKVLNMTLVTTTILTFDNQTMIVPNKKIWGDVIRNVTAQDLRRVDMTFGIGYGDDFEHAERVLCDIINSDERVLSEPAPVIKLHQLGESSVDFIVRPWVKREDYWNVFWDTTKGVKQRFDAEGISIPFPQRDVHHYYPDGRGPDEARREESAAAAD